MKIAQIAPIVERVPPKKYGGTERVVYALTEELVKMGHDVTLFASGDSITSAKLVSVSPKSLRELKVADPYGANIFSWMNFGLGYQVSEEFDIIHDHMGTLSLPTANLSKTPVVMTYHGPFTQEVQDIYSMLNSPYVASISKNQGSVLSNQVNHIGTVHNGLQMDDYPFSDTPGDYLLFVGRITLEKGVHHAINVAKKLGKRLIIAAKLDHAFAPDVEYYETQIKPLLDDDQIRWIGEVEEKERNELMKGALAFLHPVTWPEPFGLTLIESMACGTPVVAFGLGSIPEVIADGKSGFVVETEEQMVEAVKNISLINRKECREYAISHFGGRKMAESYLAVYEKILRIEALKRAANKNAQAVRVESEQFKSQISISDRLAQSKFMFEFARKNNQSIPSASRNSILTSGMKGGIVTSNNSSDNRKNRR